MERESELIGAVGFSVMTVRPGDTSLAIGIGDLPIVSTSYFVNLMESAAVAAISEFLEPGETTRLVRVELEAIDAVGIGTEIRATAKCSGLSGRDLTFECDIYDGERHIAHALMKRAAVERVSFLARTAAQSFTSSKPLS